jgi:hypothetical protein
MSKLLGLYEKSVSAKLLAHVIRKGLTQFNEGRIP